VSVDQPSQLAAVAERLRAEKTVPSLLSTTARSFGEVLSAPACTISRVIGDLLVDLVQYEQEGKPDRLGHGYLISDYPLTRAVIEEREPRTVFAGDPEADPSETALLAELGFDALLMVALEAEDGAWGLVEVYGDRGRPFDDEQVRLARVLAREASERLRQLERPA
jgi:GAF domain-containing protein